MRISTAVAALAAALVMVQPAHAQAKGKQKAAKPAKPAAAAPAGPSMAAPASLAGRWVGTYTSDVTQKSGSFVLVLNGSDESANGQLQLTPTGGRTVAPEGAMESAAPAKGKKAAPAQASGGLAVTAMKSSDDKVSGSVDGAYVDPGCNCSVVSTFEGELNGNTIVGTISARDARTGQWNLSSFTATKGGAAKR
jgi:hypothetical protein